MPWFNPSWQQSTIQLLTHSPTVGWRENWKGKCEKEKLMSWYKNSSIIKKKFKKKCKGGNRQQRERKTKPKKNKRCKWKQSVTTNWPMPSQSQIALRLPSLPTSTPSFIAGHDIIWSGISLGSVGVGCPGCAPSQLLVHPQPAHWWGRVRSRKALGAVQALLSNN